MTWGDDLATTLNNTGLVRLEKPDIIGQEVGKTAWVVAGQLLALSVVTALGWASILTTAAANQSGKPFYLICCL